MRWRSSRLMTSYCCLIRPREPLSTRGIRLSLPSLTTCGSTSAQLRVAGCRYWGGATEEPNRDAVLIEAAERFGCEQEDARLATWRALVWLGEDARPIWSGIDPESLSGEERRHLAPTAAALGLQW